MNEFIGYMQITDQKVTLLINYLKIADRIVPAEN